MKSTFQFASLARRSILAVAIAAVMCAAPACAAGLYPTNGTFGTGTGYSPGDINGQQGWLTVGNSWVSGAVVPTPAGAPINGGQSLLISTNSNPSFAGVTTGVVTPLVAPYGAPGSQTVYTSPQLSPVGNSTSFDFWFRSGPSSAAAATASGINSGTDFFQANMASGLDRFGRAGLFQSDGATYEVQSDSYKTSNNVNGVTETVATGLNWGQWYHMQGTVTFAPPTTDGGGVTTNNDTLTETIKDASGNVVGTLTDGSTWTLAWAFPGPFGFPVTGQSLFAVDGLNFLTRDSTLNGGTILANQPLMFLDIPAIAQVPEPGSFLLLGVGVAALAMLRRRKA